MTEETLNMVEDEIQKTLSYLDKMDPAERSKAISDVVKLMERMTEAENANERWFDNDARREIEKSRIQSTQDVEAAKQNIDWKRMCIEIGKVAIPAMISLVNLKVWRTSYLEMLGFEETGHLKTSASREVRLPKILR